MMRILWLLLLVLLNEAFMANTSCVTKRKCSKLGVKSGVVATCQPKTEDCEGKKVTGKKYCKDYKSCGCCVPPKDCSDGTLPSCEALNGTCISQDAVCDGREVTYKTFCKSTDTCKCCFPETTCDCPKATCEAVYQNQSYNGICRMDDCHTGETKADACPNSNCNCCINVTDCPNGLFMAEGSSQCYVLFLGGGSWEDAVSKCRSEGLELAHPKNPLQLRSYIVANISTTVGETTYFGLWTWLNARGDGTQFTWQDDGQLLYTNSTYWIPGKPGYQVTQDRCLLLSANAANMNAYPLHAYGPGQCTGSSHALCELV